MNLRFYFLFFLHLHTGNQVKNIMVNYVIDSELDGKLYYNIVLSLSFSLLRKYLGIIGFIKIK